MMFQPAPLEAREIESSAHPDNCSRKKERRGLPLVIRRMVGLETAASMLGGKQALADALGIAIRSLSYKFTAERGCRIST